MDGRSKIRTKLLATRDANSEITKTTGKSHGDSKSEEVVEAS